MPWANIRSVSNYRLHVFCLLTALILVPVTDTWAAAQTADSSAEDSSGSDNKKDQSAGGDTSRIEDAVEDAGEEVLQEVDNPRIAVQENLDVMQDVAVVTQEEADEQERTRQELEEIQEDLGLEEVESLGLKIVSGSDRVMDLSL